MTDLGKPEINRLNLYIFVVFVADDEIFWLQISVDNTVLVAMVDGLHDLLENMASFVFTEEFLFHNHIKKLSSVAYLGDEIDVLGVLEILVKFEDVGVIEGLQNLHLIFEPLLVLDLLPRNRLACSDLFCGFVEHAVHYSVRA